MDDPKVDRLTLRPGDFLISRSNTLDNVGRIGVFRGGLENCAFPDLMMRFRPKDGVDLRYLEAYLRSETVARFIRKHATGTSGSMKKINRSTVQSIPVLVPPIEEQIRIGEAAWTWGCSIERVGLLISKKEQYFVHLRNQVLRRPERAVRTRLRAITRELAKRNGARLSRDSVMGVTNLVGMRPMRQETVAENIERYKVVPPRAFAYNPMRLNVGSIAMSPFDVDVLVSPDYVVFECDEAQLLPGYLHHLCRSRPWKRHFDTVGSGGVRVRIYYGDLATLTFYLPPVEIQIRIVRTLDAAEEELELLRRLSAAMRAQKRGLMQKLLTGKWRLPVASDGSGEEGN